jgi:hypothetical protein
VGVGERIKKQNILNTFGGENNIILAILITAIVVDLVILLQMILV